MNRVERGKAAGVTGYDEAVAWLRDNAPGWLLERSMAKLVPGSTHGAPTETRYTVELVERDAQLRQAIGSGYVRLEGEGATMVDAVTNAVGGRRA